MPGPNFIEGPKESNWLKRNSQKIVLTLIVILLATGAYYLYKNYQERTALLRPTIEGNEQMSPLPSASPLQPTVSSPAKTETVKTPIPVAKPEIKVENSNIIATAQKGNGATHLARQALKEYLKDKSDLAGQLKAEQKIYIEDYLQKHTTHPDILKVGNQITFSQDLIKEAVASAQKLSDKQINNLHKYVLLAPSL